MNDALDIESEKSKLLERAGHVRSASGGGVPLELDTLLRDPGRLGGRREGPGSPGKGMLAMKLAAAGAAGPDKRVKAVTPALLLANTAVNALQPLLVKATQTGGLSFQGLAQLNVLTFMGRCMCTYPLILGCDALGRRAGLLLHHVVTLLVFSLLSYHFGWNSLLVASALLGVMSNLPRVLGTLLLADLATGANAAGTVHAISTMAVAGKLLGVLSAGLCATVSGARLAMSVQAGVAGVGLLHTWLGMPETARGGADARAAPASLRALGAEWYALMTPNIIWALVASPGATLISTGMLYQGLAMRCHNECPEWLEASTYALLYAAVVVCPTLLLGPLAWLADKHGAALLVMASSALLMLLALLFGAATHGAVLAATVVCAGVLNAVTVVGVNALLVPSAESGGDRSQAGFVAVALYDLWRAVGVGLVQWGAWAVGLGATFQLLALLMLLQLLWLLHTARKAAEHCRPQRESSSKEKDVSAGALHRLNAARWPLTCALVVAFAVGQRLTRAPVLPPVVIPSADQMASVHNGPASEHPFAALYANPAHIAEMARYKEARGQCAWTKYTLAEWNEKFAGKGQAICYTSSESRAAHEAKPPVDRAYGLLDGPEGALTVNTERCPTDLGSYNVEMCEVNGTHPENDGDKFTWLIYRFGSFQGKGELDWHQLAVRDFGNLDDRMNNGSVWTTGSVFGPIDVSTGNFIGYPPVRNHYTHVTYLGQATPTLWEKNLQCPSDQGGTDCYIQTFPPDFALRLTGAVQYVADFSHVGATADAGTTFAVEAALRLRADGSRPPNVVSRLLSPLGYPGARNTGNSHLLELPAEESMIWSQTLWPANGTLRGAYLHAHMKRFDELWVFAAPAFQLGLNEGSLINTAVDPAALFIPSKLNLTNAKVKEILKQNFAASLNRGADDVRPLCVGKRAVDTVDGKPYDRRTELECRPHSFESGNLFTQVAFYTADERSPEEAKAAPYHMDSNPRYLVEWEDPSKFSSSMTLYNFRDGVCYECYKHAQFVQQFCNRGLNYMHWCAKHFGASNLAAMGKSLTEYFMPT